MNNLEEKRAETKKEFEYFLRNCLKAARAEQNVIFCGESTISSYMSYLDRVFEYCPDKKGNIESLYDITDSATINSLFKQICEDEEFKKLDAKNPSQYFRSNSLKSYVCFVNAFDHFSKVNHDCGHRGDTSKALQQIFFGAPGTGKSHKVNDLVGEHESYLAATDKDVRRNQFSKCGCAKANHYADVLSKPGTFNQDVFAINNLEELKSLLESCDGDDKVKNPRHSALRAYIDFVSQPTVFRTTFHPDYDYAQFVGSYKPKKENGTITYAFVPQVFAKAYKRAKETSEPVYLVIEEINRGNCAQIFGDIFQLLDRNESGESQYEIDVDSDFAEWLGQDKLRLPSNFNILATMNTSDQSLFPMDSAFKRRFDWEYVPISFEGKSAANFQIEIGSSENVKYYSWQTFVEKVNAKILDLTESEDKQLGEYFIQPDKKQNDSDTEKIVISEERFKGKVMFYLWNEICKDEHKNGSFFKIENEFFTFQDLYKDDSKLAAFMEEIEKAGKN